MHKYVMGVKIPVTPMKGVRRGWSGVCRTPISPEPSALHGASILWGMGSSHPHCRGTCFSDEAVARQAVESLLDSRCLAWHVVAPRVCVERLAHRRSVHPLRVSPLLSARAVPVRKCVRSAGLTSNPDRCCRVALWLCSFVLFFFRLCQSHCHQCRWKLLASSTFTYTECYQPSSFLPI